MTTIKYETTEVDAEKTVSEIAILVRKAGGTSFGNRWDDDGNLTEVRFSIKTNDGVMPVVLKARTDTIYAVLAGAGSNKGPSAVRAKREKKLRAQAYRVAWRNLKHLVEGLLTAAQLGLAEPYELFLGYAEVRDPKTGELRSMAEHFKEYSDSLPLLLTQE